MENSMKKKIFVAVLALYAAFACAFGIVGCENDARESGATGHKPSIVKPDVTGGNEKPDETPDSHTHKFNCRDTSEKYLKSSAECTHKAEYYLSCECGEKGEDTFEDGEFFHLL